MIWSIMALLSFALMGFIPANVTLEEAKQMVNKRKRAVIEEEGRSRGEIRIGRYVYRVASATNSKQNKSVAKESSPSPRPSREKGFDCPTGCRVLIGLLSLLVLGVISVRFYVKGQSVDRLRSRRAFSLLELIIVMAIFSVVIWAVSALLFSTRPFFSVLERKMTELNKARRVQLYLEKVFSKACEQDGDTIELYPDRVVFPYCSVRAGSRMVVGKGEVRFTENKILVDSTGSGQEYLLARDISSWQVVRNDDKIQIRYEFAGGGSYQFQVALLTD